MIDVDETNNAKKPIFQSSSLKKKGAENSSPKKQPQKNVILFPNEIIAEANFENKKKVSIDNNTNFFESSSLPIDESKKNKLNFNNISKIKSNEDDKITINIKNNILDNSPS
jgi:hypothetical protein